MPHTSEVRSARPKCWQEWFFWRSLSCVSPGFWWFEGVVLESLPSSLAYSFHCLSLNSSSPRVPTILIHFWLILCVISMFEKNHIWGTWVWNFNIWILETGDTIYQYPPIDPRQKPKLWEIIWYILCETTLWIEVEKDEVWQTDGIQYIHNSSPLPFTMNLYFKRLKMKHLNYLFLCFLLPKADLSCSYSL